MSSGSERDLLEWDQPGPADERHHRGVVSPEVDPEAPGFKLAERDTPRSGFFHGQAPRFDRMAEHLDERTVAGHEIERRDQDDAGGVANEADLITEEAAPAFGFQSLPCGLVREGQFAGLATQREHELVGRGRAPLLTQSAQAWQRPSQ